MHKILARIYSDCRPLHHSSMGSRWCRPCRLPTRKPPLTHTQTSSCPNSTVACLSGGGELCVDVCPRVFPQCRCSPSLNTVPWVVCRRQYRYELVHHCEANKSDANVQADHLGHRRRGPVTAVRAGVRPHGGQQSHRHPSRRGHSQRPRGLSHHPGMCWQSLRFVPTPAINSQPNSNLNSSKLSSTSRRLR